MRQLKITKSITNRESASLDKYLQEIGREDLITVEEEVELAQRIRKGDRVALEKLTRANLRFVVSVAKQYQNQGLSLPDLINEGNLGLIKAAEKFDETRGFKFISYAVWWIRQSILQALAEQSRIVRLPLNQVGSLNKISKAFSKFEQENERRPSPEELADELEIPEGTSVARIQRLQLADEEPVTLMENYIEYAKVPGIEAYENQFVALYQFLEEKFGLQIDETRDRISAKSATFMEAQVLKTEPKDALLVVHRVTYWQNRPVSIDHVRIIGSKYEVEISGKGRSK